MFARILLAAVAVTALTITVLGTSGALAGKGGIGGGGNYSGTITFATSELSAAKLSPSWGDSVMFAVEANVKENDLYNLWVVNRCTQGGVTVALAFAPVDFGTAGPIGFEWPGGGAADCTAHVETFEGKMIRGASMTYTVGP